VGAGLRRLGCKAAPPISAVTLFFPQRQHLDPILGHRHRMLPLRRQAVVAGNHRPTVAQRPCPSAPWPVALASRAPSVGQ